MSEVKYLQQVKAELGPLKNKFKTIVKLLIKDG